MCTWHMCLHACRGAGGHACWSMRLAICHLVRGSLRSSSRSMGSKPSAVCTSLRFSWRAFGTACKTEGSLPLETHTAAAQRAFGPEASWICQSLFLWGHPPVIDRYKEMKLLKANHGGFSWECQSSILIQLIANRAWKQIYHTGVKKTSFLLKPVCALC